MVLGWHHWGNPWYSPLAVWLDNLAWNQALALDCANYLQLHLFPFTYLKFPKPLLCCSVWENISYFWTSLSDTDLLANFIASSKCTLVTSGEGSSYSCRGGGGAGWGMWGWGMQGERCEGVRWKGTTQYWIPQQVHCPTMSTVRGQSQRSLLAWGDG